MLSFLQSNLRWVLAGFSIFFVSCFGQTYFIALSVPDIQREFGLSSGEFGAIFMMLTSVSALMMMQVGFFIDRLRLQHLLLVLLPLFALGSLLLALAQNLIVLVAGMFLLRFIGQGMMVHATSTTLARWFTAERGRAVSLASLGMSAGEVVLPIGFVTIAALLGWKMAWAAVAILLVLLSPLLLSLTARDRAPASTNPSLQESETNGFTKAQALSSPFFWLLLIGILPIPAFSSAIFIHHGTLLEQREWPDHLFASAWATYAVAAVVATPIAGILVDRFSALRVMPFLLVGHGLACLVLSIVTDEWSLFVFMLLHASSGGLYLALYSTLWPEVYGTRYLGDIKGAASGILIISTALGPWISGWLIDAEVPLQSQLLVMGTFCLLMLPVQRIVCELVLRRYNVVTS